MLRKISAGVLTAMVLLVPAAPAAARAGTPGLDASCQTVERKLFKDIRKMVTIDLETATDNEVRLVANQILAEVTAESLPVLPGAMQTKLGGTEEELRAFLKKEMLTAWRVGLRVSVNRTMANAGANVDAAAQKALNAGTIDASLTYLNEELYAARELDCAAQPSPSASITPSTSPSATASASPGISPSATPSDTTTGTPSASPSAADGGLPVTGSSTGTVAAAGGVLLLLGGAGYLIGRRRRSRFVA